MAVAQRYVAQQYSGRGGPSGLADVLEVLLDKGLVIDAFVRVSLVGIELLTVDARVVVASVDTYLRFAEAVNRLDLLQANNAQTLGELVGKPGRSGSNGRGERSRDEQEAEKNGRRAPALEGGHGARSEGGRQSERDGERSSSEEDDGGSRREQESRRQEGSRGDKASDEGGLLSRLKQRGQAF